MKAKQLVTLHEWNAYQRVVEERGFRPEEHSVLFYPKLSILIDDDRKVINFVGWKTRVTFLIARRPGDGEVSVPRLACDVFDDAQQPDPRINQKSCFLRKLGVSYIVYYLKYDKLIKDDETSFDCEGQFAMIPKAFNFAQYQAIMSFDIGLLSSGERFSIIHEPSLDMIVEMGGKSQKTLIEQINLKLKTCRGQMGRDIDEVRENFFQHTSVDGLFCVEVPHGIPLFAIEYDGSCHSTKKGKDLAKNILFKQLGLPLIRVRSEFYRPNQSDIILKNVIHMRIAWHIQEELLKANVYIKMIADFLSNEAAKLGTESQAGSNIKKLTEKMNAYLSKREIWHEGRLKQVNERAIQAEQLTKGNPWMDDLDQWIEWQRGIYEEDWKNRFGVPLEEGFVEEREGIRFVARIKAEPHHRRAGVAVSQFSAGPYMVEDATGRFNLVPIVRDMLKHHVQRQLDEYFLSGSPSLKAKVAIANDAAAWSHRRGGQHHR